MEDEELPFLEALLLPPLLLEEALELLLFLAAPLLLAFEDDLEAPLELLLPFLLAPLELLLFLAALFDAPFDELFVAPLLELLPAAFFAVAMLF